MIKQCVCLDFAPFPTKKHLAQNVIKSGLTAGVISERGLEIVPLKYFRVKMDSKELLAKCDKRASHESPSAPSQSPTTNNHKGVKRVTNPQGLCK